MQVPLFFDLNVLSSLYHKSIALKQRQNGCSAEVIAYADKANERLRRRFYKMEFFRKLPHLFFIVQTLAA